MRDQSGLGLRDKKERKGERKLKSKKLLRRRWTGIRF